MNEVQYMDLGLMPYQEAWQRQERLMDELISERLAGKPGRHYLLMVEHPHVYTLGKHGNQNNMLADRLLLHAKGAELIRTDRGGDITYHGPGQLVVYPVFRLDTLETGIKDYIFRLEEVVIRSIAEYGLTGCRLEKATGVWLDIHLPVVRKICAIGVRCSQSVTMHGFALNVNTDLNCFGYINPCGFADKGVTSLQKETGEKLDMPTVKKLVLRQFETVFGIKFVPDFKIPD